MKNLTVSQLNKLNACPPAIEAFRAQSERDPIKLIRTMIKMKQQHLDWASWLITRLITKRQAVQYAVYAASQVLDVFEQKYPDDTRPREAIEAAKAWIKRPTKKNRDVARAAADAVYVASHADSVFYAYWADSADSAANAAARAASAAAARAASRAASAAASDAWAVASCVASYAASDASSDVAARQDAMLVKILKYGLKLLRSKS